MNTTEMLSHDPLADLLTVAEVGKILRISKPFLYQMISSGQLPSVKFGRAIRLMKSDVASLVDEQRRVGSAKK